MTNKDFIKQGLTIDNIEYFLTYMQAEPIRKNDIIVSKTICHNPIGEGSHKLYYYANTSLFKCFTDCDGDAFDIFDLVIKIFKLQGKELSLPQAITYIANFFNIPINNIEVNNNQENKLEDWIFLNKYNNLTDHKSKKIVELKEYDNNVIKNFPQPAIIPWIREGIKKEICDNKNIHFNPCNNSVIIPHYNIDNKLIGIRERTLSKEQEQYGKYKPAIFKGRMYNHPLGYNLYNLNWSKNNIKSIGKAIILEGEKGCLQYSSYFGKENDISVAVCGSNLLTYQVELLISSGAQELIIGFDKQFQDINSDEAKRWIKKLEEIYNKFNNYITISFIFDKHNLLPYKASPTDLGKDIFLKLFKERIFL